MKLEIWLDESYTDRLWAIKEEQGKDNLTGNEFAKELLKHELYRLHPELVQFDENGDIIPRKKTEKR